MSVCAKLFKTNSTEQFITKRSWMDAMGNPNRKLVFRSVSSENIALKCGAVLWVFGPRVAC